MPSLDDMDLIRLRTAPIVLCDECDRATFQYYCREHDVFFWFNHSMLCRRGAEDFGHQDHRIC